MNLWSHYDSSTEHLRQLHKIFTILNSVLDLNLVDIKLKLADLAIYLKKYKFL